MTFQLVALIVLDLSLIFRLAICVFALKLKIRRWNALWFTVLVAGLILALATTVIYGLWETKAVGKYLLGAGGIAYFYAYSRLLRKENAGINALLVDDVEDAPGFARRALRRMQRRRAD